MRKICLISTVALSFLLILTLFGLSALAQQPDAADPKLAKIDFQGLKRLTPEQLIKVSGLELGQPVTVEALDTAAQRLMDSGLVHNLSYRLQTKAGSATVSFKIEEGRGGQSVVIFDNFISFTDEELGDAVRREVPSFNGAAPNAGNMTDAITRALQKLLVERKIAGSIDYHQGQNAERTQLEHVFNVKGVSLPICSLHFPGARNVSEDKLIKQSQDLLGTDYSRRLASVFAVNNLFPLYRELGQLRATFSRPEAIAQTLENCKDGVELTIPVFEGSTYVWDKADWKGNRVLSQSELDAALALKPGELANGIKLDQSIAAVMKAYAHKGYLGATVRAQEDFDDAGRKVSYQMEVKEGPLYHMGNLSLKGFSDSLGNYLRGKWELKRDEVYDQEYAENFFKNEFPEIMRKVFEERQEQGRPKPKKVVSQAFPDRASATVDVTFELVDEAPEPN